MRVIRIKKVLEYTGLGRSTVYKKMDEGTFPLSVSLGGKARGWILEEVEAWVQARIDERNVPSRSLHQSSSAFHASAPH